MIDDLIQALDLAANAGTDSLIDESEIKEWFITEALELMNDDQRRQLAGRFKDALESGEDSLVMVKDQEKQDALSILRDCA